MTHLNALAAAAQPFLGFPLAPSQLDQFERFLSEILEWNAKFNLTAIRDPESIRVKHFLDSLTVALATGDLNRKTLADVGTGAGFPGIPLKIAFPELKLTLIDSIGKKLKFCERVCALFGWTDVATLHARAEDAGRMPQLRERQDFAVARAVTRLPVLCEYLMPLVRHYGHGCLHRFHEEAVIVNASNHLAAIINDVFSHHGAIRYIFQI